MPIRTLPPLLVNQIAAGEVVERPASVVKELVENSLDAGARRIDVVIEGGGRELIRVADDGRGIPPGELVLAVAPHATSKLDAPEQLASIATLGFRGEALASIGSVGRLSIVSRVTTEHGPAESGYRLEVAGGEGRGAGEPQPAGCAPGTVVEVRDLFFNTPARRKFLRSPQVEFGHISEWLSRAAMARPGVAVRLTHGGRVVLDLPAEQEARARCVQVLGRELDEAMLGFEMADRPTGAEPDGGAMSVWGLAGLPAIARATSKFQYLYVNDRPIRDRSVSHAVREAYRGLIPSDQHPVAVVKVWVDPSAVDVNVHPAKSEVRFREGGRVHRLVLTALRQRLLGSDLTPTATLNDRPRPGRSSVPAGVGPGAPGPAGPAPQGKIETGAFVNFFKRMDPTQKGFDYGQVRRSLADDGDAEHPDDAGSVSEPADERADASGGGAQGTLIDAPTPKPLILQVHNSYLVTQDEQGLVIVDQHALHERVMFEQLRERLLTGNLESQRLLTPAVLPASAGRQAVLESVARLFARIGVEVGPLGPDTIGIHGFPSFLFDRGVDPVAFVEQVLDRVEQGDIQQDEVSAAGEGDPAASESALREVLDMMACKAAVKAGEHMSEPELATLLRQRELVERSGSCPHGRPTTIRLTIRDLEKHFKRV